MPTSTLEEDKSSQVRVTFFLPKCHFCDVSAGELRYFTSPKSKVYSGNSLLKTDLHEGTRRAQGVSWFAVCLCLLHVLENSDLKGAGFREDNGGLVSCPWGHL